MTQLEFDQYISPDGVVYKLNDNVGKFIYGLEGQGMPPIKYQTQQGPLQHGETPLDFRLGPRIISFVFTQNGGCRTEYWSLRSALIDAIRPNRKTATQFPGTLRKILPDGTIRDLYVLIESGPVFVGSKEGEWDEFSIKEALRFIAHDPLFFNPVVKSYTFILTINQSLVFPITFPIDFSSDSIDVTTNITYSGTWETYPIITVEGPLNGFIIENESTDERIFLNYNIPAGTTITIDLNYGVKTVVDNTGTNLIGSISSDSDLATFHIAPNPEVAGGINTLSIYGSNAALGVTDITVKWYDKYIGI